MEITAQFLHLLQDFDVHHLDRHPAAVYGVWPDFTLAFVNTAWHQFFEQNGGRDAKRFRIGADLFQAIPRVLEPFYRSHYEAALIEQRPWEHIYECSGPDEVRQFHMLTYPLAQRQGLLIINSLQYAAPRNEPLEHAHASYRDRHGIVHQCSHCRRVREPGSENVWDWVPSLVQNPHPKVSHGLCPACFAFYYGERGDKTPFLLPVATNDPPSLFAERLLRGLQSPVMADGSVLTAKPLPRSAGEAFYSENAGKRLD